MLPGGVSSPPCKMACNWPGAKPPMGWPRLMACTTFDQLVRENDWASALPSKSMPSVLNQFRSCSLL